jgi:bisphosphoglycerate-independent phosphoglycerate mutase (AlkP superfamily)
VNDRLVAAYPWVQIHASGEDVGLPTGVMGGSAWSDTEHRAGAYCRSGDHAHHATHPRGIVFTNPTHIAARSNARKIGGSVHLMAC